MKFFASKELSIICFFINIAFFVWMATSGAYGLSIIPLIMGAICLSNVFL